VHLGVVFCKEMSFEIHILCTSQEHAVYLGRVMELHYIANVL